MSSKSLLDALISEARDIPIEAGPDDETLVARAVLAGKARHATTMRRRRFVATSSVLALAAMVTLAWLGTREGPPPAVAPPIELVELTLPPGDRLTATADARFDVASSIEPLRVVRMIRGAMLFDVAPLGGGSRFEVQTPDARVRVRGTIFAVDVSDRGTSVRVYEGSVELARTGEAPIVLAAGATNGASSARLDALDARGRAAAAERALHPRIAPVAAAATATAPAPIAPPPTRVRRHAHADAPAEAAAEVTVESAARARLAEADTLRATGRVSEAADAYEDAAHRLDGATAHTAAFLAAELRMRRLHDPAGALRVLDDTHADATSSPLRERGLALRADALERLGRRDALRDVARTYLDELPTGPHADAMRGYLAD